MTAAQRSKELGKLPKATLAQMHADNGGLMGLASYMKWRKDELVTALLEDEGLDPWHQCPQCPGCNEPGHTCPACGWPVHH